MEQQEALMEISWKFVSKFRPYKVMKNWLRNDAKPGEVQAQAHQKGTKLMPKRAKISQNDAEEQKYGFLHNIEPIGGAILNPFSIPNLIKCFKKAFEKSSKI